VGQKFNFLTGRVILKLNAEADSMSRPRRQRVGEILTGYRQRVWQSIGAALHADSKLMQRVPELLGS
jgi:hypothetical protein